MDYKITPICLGYNYKAEKGSFTYRKDPGQITTAAFLVYLISGEGHHILVDSGGPNPALAASMSYPHLSDAVYLKDELERRGVSCEEIDTIILTHLHWDHCYNLELFPQAKIYVQAKELHHAVTPSAFDSYFYVAKPGDGLPGWMTGFAQLIRMEGDTEVFPGIWVLAAPGHAPGQSCVLVKAKEHTYLVASDMYPMFENYEKQIPNGIALSFENWYKSDTRLRGLNAVVLPGHDPRVMEKKVYE